jgi:hypothetical protein
VVERAIRLALDALKPERQHKAHEKLVRDVEQARAECDRLADAIQRGGPIDVLIDRLRAAQTRRWELEAQLAAQQTSATPVVAGDLEGRLRRKLADWRGLLTRNVETGREVLRVLLVGPLRFTPIVEARRRAYAFDGAIALERLVSGVIDLPTLTRMASPTGFEPVFWP